MKINEKVKSALNSILHSFENGHIPEAISLAVYPTFDIPMSKWSLLNRLLAVITGTEDARGFKQWKEVGRWVKKGAKSFTILAPRFKMKSEEREDGKDYKKIQMLTGFIGVPVFRVEDTDGESLDYQRLELPELPLLEVAKSWGINTKAVSGGSDFYGAFAPGVKEIHLASPEEMIFFHELSHAAHDRLSPLRSGQLWKQEIVAELSSACLCRLVGRKPENLGKAHKYIAGYAKEANLSPVQACLKVINDVENVVTIILEASREAA